MPAMESDYDLIIIGGGINGAGIARDAALRGLKTCLVEQDDLCSATTRWSSRLIHGGLRYLEYGELSLVHESLREREILFRHAPHLVRPLPLLIPVYDHSQRGLATVSFGLWLYDLLSRGRSVPGFERMTAAQAARRVPGLDPTGLDGAALYWDGQVPWVERLVVENALSAHQAGATILLRHRASLLLDDGRVRGVEVEATAGGVRRQLSARAVVNAAGPWVDRVLGTLPRRPARLMGPTRGTHVVVPRLAGVPELGLYLEARSDGRPFFVLPWNGMTLIGTTDIRDDGDPGAVRAGPDEVDYLLRETAQLLPQAGLGPGSELYHYAGLRPLPRQGRRFTGSITRRHQVRHHAPLASGLYSVIGGKITTYRSLAEEAVDRVMRRLRRAGDSVTAGQPLPGAGDQDQVLAQLADWPAIPPASRQHLWSVYGARAVQVAALTVDDGDLAQPLSAGSPAIGAEIVHALRREFALHITDVLFRRCMAGLAPDLGAAALEPALAIAARHLGWDAAHQAAERARYAEERAFFTELG